MAKAQVKHQTKPKNVVYLKHNRRNSLDYDPIIEEICDIIHKSGKSAQEISQMTSKSTGGALKVARGTIDKWLKGDTKRPQNYTITWVLHVLGFERRVVKK